MKNNTQVITRREFIRTTTQASLAIAFGTPLLGQKEKEVAKKATVLLIRHPEATSVDGKIKDPRKNRGAEKFPYGNTQTGSVIIDNGENV